MEINEFCSLLKDSKQFDDLEVRILRAMLILTNRDVIKIDAAKIAQEAGMSVTNAYKYLYSLQKKGGWFQFVFVGFPPFLGEFAFKGEF